MNLPDYKGALKPAPWGMDFWTDQILTGDVLDKLREIPECSAHCVVTSPPYFGLRDYGVTGQMGTEQLFSDYIKKMVEVFREVRRILIRGGTLWLNLGDCYAGSGKGRSSDGTHGVSASDKQASNVGAVMGRLAKVAEQPGLKSKDLMEIPWRVAFALQDDGWWLRKDNIWSKPNPMTESVKDRTTTSHEYVFHFAKDAKYYYDAKAVQEKAVGDGRVKYPSGWDPVTGHQSGGHRRKRGRYDGDTSRIVGHTEVRNRRSVWEIPTESFQGEFCTACRTYYTKNDHNGLAEVSKGAHRTARICRCGKSDQWMSHFATFPQKLAAVCVLAGCPEGGTVLDPFIGSGTTALVAHKLRRHYVGIELHPDFAEMARQRIEMETVQLKLL